ncbi:hypothetical protein EN780_03475 [Mesorhizobium sp. M4B.F.Ca.ET.089.01.1.1]|uniref:hypothetical protein n=1 Tax=Mesorhizobium sp. M4B.F.Ca.ET.089.01.1.1 TaxID=2496662 RepID=UPI000FE38736|nr:hypothetical protein [Mesorhizobium sp. M4B.F.Ca.ET.089.01.1.1]RWX70468.1 hypothetical protein EN780_03475 [Mesorhizobium sp. M4B.F.Ca.ET.089.01.1.1]
MLRYSYEWIDADEYEDDEDGNAHWASDLYAIFDGKLGLSAHQAIAWTWERDDAERIVNALNQVEQQKWRAAAVIEMATHQDKYDLSDLLD